MIRWCQKLYLDFAAEKIEKKLRKRIERGKLNLFVYCITLAQNENNLFEIIRTDELLFHYYRKKDIYIIGLAVSRDSAVELVAEIIDEMYQSTGTFHPREYFSFS
ncbi:hypothetical protein [Anaeromicropila populeti]|uniref:Uncharacterized protein n=1 Tax=Anaeromicropila populeti TaxID=37658 RepID=A0A1I6KIS1_9FIRM|nr:hypothetical protein [Anaeromicropila populeti]SFR91139.1 hypothetical protein SAMN05661086_02453 [Anaeromicropila populeti]